MQEVGIVCTLIGISFGMWVGYLLFYLEPCLTYQDGSAYYIEDISEALELACRKIFLAHNIEPDDIQIMEKKRMLLREATKK